MYEGNELDGQVKRTLQLEATKTFCNLQMGLEHLQWVLEKGGKKQEDINATLKKCLGEHFLSALDRNKTAERWQEMWEREITGLIPGTELLVVVNDKSMYPLVNKVYC